MAVLGSVVHGCSGPRPFASGAGFVGAWVGTPVFVVGTAAARVGLVTGVLPKTGRLSAATVVSVWVPEVGVLRVRASGLILPAVVTWPGWWKMLEVAGAPGWPCSR